MSETGNMWANMLGLGPLFSTVNDPAFQAHIRSVVEAITSTAEMCRRIEMKLDLLLEAEGFYGSGLIPSRAVRSTNVFAQLGADGAGRPSVASGAADNGTGNGPPSGESDAS